MFLSTKFMRIVEGVALVALVGLEMALAVKSYKNSEIRDIEAKEEQTKIIRNMANNVENIFKEGVGKNEEGAA
jgi:capsular polysaccharide biosynthesis protein